MTAVVNTNTGWSVTRTGAIGSTLQKWLARGPNVVRAYYAGGNLIKYDWSKDESSDFGAAVTIDSTAGNNDVMLNTNVVYDEVTGRLHILYGRNIDAAAPAVLCHRYTDNPFTATPTFSAEHVIDNGVGKGNNRFYRVALSAFNGQVTIHYTTEDNSNFTTDGKIWRASSSDGGATWGSPASVFTGLVGPYEPNCCQGKDGSVFLTWYDDGSNTNQKGDLYIAISRDGGVTWPSAGTKLTTTADYGRPRPACSDGKVWIVANKPWNSGATKADVWSISSTDNGATWGSPTLRASHAGSTDLDHPDVIVVNNFVAMLWVDQSTNPSKRNLIYSTDGGATFSSPVNVLSASVGANSDAPRLIASDNRLIAIGGDSVTSGTMWAYNPIFALLPKAQNTGGIDDFSGYTNGTLLNTGNWSASALASVPLKANGASGVTRGYLAGTFKRAGSYRNNVTYTGNVEVWATKTSDGAGGDSEVFIWNPTVKSGYNLTGSNQDFGNSHAVLKYTAGANSTMSSDAVASNSGEVQALQVIGDFVIGWKQVSGVWYEIGAWRAYDTTYRSSLKLEMEIVGSAHDGPVMGSFGGGSLVVPANTVAPAASGAVVVGQVLSCDDGTWSGSPSKFAYQWQTSSDGVTWTDVPYATLPFFVVADASKSHRCKVTAWNSVGNSTAAASNGLTQRDLTDTLSYVADSAPAAQRTFARSAADTLSALADGAPARQLAAQRAAADTASAVADGAPAGQAARQRTAADTLSALADGAPAAAKGNPRSAADTLSALADGAPATGRARPVADTLSALADGAPRLGASRPVADTLASIGDSSDRQATHQRAAADTLASIADTAAGQAARARSTADTLSALADGAPSTQRARNQAAADTLSSISDAAPTRQAARARAAADTLSALSDGAPAAHPGRDRRAADTLSLLSDGAPTIQAAYQRTAGDTLASIGESLSVSASGQASLSVSDTLSGLDDQAPNRQATHERTAADTISGLSDSAPVRQRANARAAADTISLLADGAPARTSARSRAAADTLATVGESVEVTVGGGPQSYSRAAADTFSALDDQAPSRLAQHQRPAADTASGLIDQAPTRVSQHLRALTDALAAVSDGPPAIRVVHTVADLLAAIADSPPGSQVSARRTVTDTLSQLGAGAPTIAYRRHVADTLATISDYATIAGAAGWVTATVTVLPGPSAQLTISTPTAMLYILPAPSASVELLA